MNDYGKYLKKHTEDIKGDDCFFCIGTTKKNSPSKDEYKRIERDIPVEIAEPGYRYASKQSKKQAILTEEQLKFYQ